jgi:hypothetical protein
MENRHEIAPGLVARAELNDRPTSRQLNLDDWTETRGECRAEIEPARGQSSASRLARGGEKGNEIQGADAAVRSEGGTPRHRDATDLLAMPEAMLTRSHLRELGLERRAIDAIFRALPVVALPGYSRPMVRVQDFLDLVARNTFRDDRVRPILRASR